jgi:hypothetical protein
MDTGDVTKLVGAAVTLLLGATVYELLVALRVIELGTLPGEGPPGASIAGWVAAVALLGAAVLCVVLAITRNAPALAALLAPAAGAFLLAYFHTFDPYYLPPRIRYSERDFVPPELVYALVAAAVAVGLLTLLRRRAGLVLSAPTILACGLAAGWASIGH